MAEEKEGGGGGSLQTLQFLHPGIKELGFPASLCKFSERGQQGNDAAEMK